ncbi:LrgB family protein [Paenibacillus sp. OAS669]|uniref:LrgB family protein n=1 Tax=Paenibacillus sp. OAS669 TaxID=2663821 RepID=UPI001789831F|nr:LrgB family protein [Paenibacillus sp. OAS669]MBE1443691.1 putative murein hydrolase (TIGR00659 family) [Paenibacillus sp. OAS669]
MIGAASLIGTVLLYIVAKRLYRYKPMFILSPIIITPLALIILLVSTGTSFESYNTGAHWLSDILQPATIAFAIPLSKYFPLIKKHATEILVSVLAGSCAAVASSIWLAEGLRLNDQLVFSLLPHSVTTPIAMNVSQTIGGIPTITAVAVMMTGIFGSVVGPYIIRMCRIRNDIARGVLLGTSSHGAGTSKAFEFSSVSGTVSSISMILAAVITLFVTPWIMAAVL